jgi:hypothetical protein
VQREIYKCKTVDVEVRLKWARPLSSHPRHEQPTSCVLTKALYTAAKALDRAIEVERMLLGGAGGNEGPSSSPSFLSRVREAGIEGPGARAPVRIRLSFQKARGAVQLRLFSPRFGKRSKPGPG